MTTRRNSAKSGERIPSSGHGKIRGRKPASSKRENSRESTKRIESKHEVPPVSSSDLLLAANEASSSARTAWMTFLGLMTYLLVAVAGVNHSDLLLNSPINLPLVNVEIPLFSFFGVAPILLLLFHLSLLVQHAILSNKFGAFSRLIEEKEDGGQRNHPDRRLVNSYIFSQLLAGPTPPKALGVLMRIMIFVTLSLLPILVLLYFQIKFLPYHNVAVTHIHRFAIFIDLFLILMYRSFVAIPFLGKPWRTFNLGPADWHWEISVRNAVVSGFLVCSVLFFSVFVATVPRGCIWPLSKDDESCFSLDVFMANLAPMEVEFGGHRRNVFVLTKVLFEGDVDPIIGAPKSLFSRNLVVTDTNISDRAAEGSSANNLTLRGRNLRFAMLDRSNLERVDLTGADLRQASMVDMNLSHSQFPDTRLEDSDLSSSNMKFSNMEWASLQDTVMLGVDLRGANLSGANLSGVDLTGSNLQGTNLTVAQLHGATLVGTFMQGASFSAAELNATDATGANAQFSDFSFAYLQGTDFSGANLTGANFNGAQLQGSDFRNAVIWHTSPPDERDFWAGDASTTRLEKPTRNELETISLAISNLGEPVTDNSNLVRFSSDAGSYAAWSTSEDRQFWQRPAPDEGELSQFLVSLACMDATQGYVAKGIVRRSLASPSLLRPHYFNGDLTAIARGIVQNSCDGAVFLGSNLIDKLCSYAKWESDPPTDVRCDS